MARDTEGAKRTIRVGEMIRDDDPVVTGREVLFDTQTLDDSAFEGGGSQSYAQVTIQHSADFANAQGDAPITAAGTTLPASGVVLPPLALGNGGTINVVCGNFDEAVDIEVIASLVVQSADGTNWIEQSTSGYVTVATGTTPSLDLSANGGSGGSGITWNSGAKRVDVANAGAYSAFVNIHARLVA